jgi:hypothetical protein
LQVPAFVSSGHFKGEMQDGQACGVISDGTNLCQGMRCGPTMLMNSREVITLVFFQNLGK